MTEQPIKMPSHAGPVARHVTRHVTGPVAGRLSPASAMSTTAGLIVGLLGFSVIVGWFAGSATLIRVHPSFVPMQFNTALGFLLVGVAITMQYRAPKPGAVVCGAAAALIGAVTLFQYVTGIDLGVDNLVVTPEITVKTSHPGRMPPNTALCFILSGIAIVVTHSRLAGPRTDFAIRCLAAATLSLAVVALIGYVARIEDAYGWADLTRMAVHTALGFTVAGIGLYFGPSRLPKPQATRSLLSDAPALVGAVVMLVSLWQALASFETREAAKAARSNAALFHARIEDRMKDRVRALKRMARRQSIRASEEFTLWRRDARAYTQDFPELQQIAVLDPSMKLRVSSGKGATKGASLSAWLGVKTELRAADTGKVTVTPTFVTRRGRRAFLVLAPKTRGGNPSGFVAGVFLVNALLTRDANHLRRQGVEVGVRERGVLIYGAPEAQKSPITVSTNSLRIGPVPWRVSAWPMADQLDLYQSNLPEGVFFAGLMLLALVASSLHFSRQANARTAESEAALDRAHVEAIRRAEAQKAVEQLNNELKATVETLAAREGDLEEAQRIAQIGSWSRDMRTGEIFFSRQQRQIYGLPGTDEEIDFEKVLKAVHPDDRVLLDQATRRAIEYGEDWAFDFRIPRPDGQQDIVHGRGRPAFDDNGNVVGLFGSTQIVTEERRLHEQMRRSERRLKRAQQIAQVGSWEWDLVADKITWSEELFRLYRMDPGEDPPDFGYVLDLIHPDDRDKVQTEVERARETGSAWNVEYRLVLPGGRIEHIHAHGEVQKDEKGAPIRLIGTSKRVSEYKELEGRLRQINAELEQFASVASHDLQEPVRKIVSFSDLLKKDLGDDLPDAARKDIGFIVDAAKRMRNLVQDLLALSKAGRASLQMEELALQACVDDALEILAHRISETGAEIECGLLPTVLGDRTLLTQLYQNLIANALKFAPEGRVPRISVGCREEDAGNVFFVRDNGIGIDPRYAQQIFEPFQRLHGRDSYEGTGIGLAICFKAVERHGGKIWVEQAEGEGAIFCFTLNARQLSEGHPAA